MNNDSLFNEIAANFDNAAAAVVKGLRNDHDRLAQDASRKGDTVSFFNDRIVNADIKDDVTNYVNAYRRESLEAIERERAKALQAVTDAPTTEEANYIVSLQGRSDMTRAEVDAALTRYKGHAAQHAIRAAAKRSGLDDVPLMTEAECRVEMLNRLSNAVSDAFSFNGIIGGDDARHTAMKNSIKGIIENGGKPMSAAEQIKAMLSK